jgi:hypothetical protein
MPTQESPHFREGRMSKKPSAFAEGAFTLRVSNMIKYRHLKKILGDQD